MCHTSQLSANELCSIRELLDASFDTFDDMSWEHACGGMHVRVILGDTLVGHGAVIMRRLLYRGHALRCGYVEAIAVAPQARRAGIGARIMDAINEIIERGYEVGALSASDEGRALYERHGWRSWIGTTWAITPEGMQRTASADDTLMVLPSHIATLDINDDIACDFRPGSLW